jgi:large subunit ribosomal protein L28
MGKSCIVTGKKTITGNRVSHAKNKTKRRLKANLQKKRLLNPATGRIVTVVISTRGMRTLKKWDREGKTYDLTALKKDGTLAI